MRRKAVFVVVAFAVQAAALLGAGAPARAAGAVRPPVIEADFPDPAIVADGLGAYYLFSTNVFVGGQVINVPVARSVDLNTWTYVTDALPTLGSWATAGFTWAPGVVHIGATWILYYTALDAASGRQCIGVATSSSPTGPYVDGRGGPIVCQLDEGGSIDPSPYIDGVGKPWLTWKSDGNAVGRVTLLWSQPLSADGLALSGAATPLLAGDRPWENGIIEAPAMVAAGGVLWLFYSAGPYDSASYATGFATCASPSGPCTKQTVNGPWLSGSASGAVGPGGESFTSTPGGQIAMAFHGWRGAVGYPSGGYRAAYVEAIDFTSGWPTWRPDLPRDGAQTAAFVRRAYADFLGRDADDGGLRYWTGALASGQLTRAAFVSVFAHSDEWIGRIVDGLYSAALGRAPDANGKAYWIDRIRSGLSVAQAASSFYGSDELYARSGATPGSYVDALYNLLLHRSSDANGRSYWVGQLSSGTPKTTIAYAFYQSDESRRDRVRALYQSLLARGPDAGGLTYWADVVATDGDIALATSLASSDEYYQHAAH